MKLHKKFDLFKYTEFARGQESIWGEHSSFIKPSTSNYLHFDQVNMYRNDLSLFVKWLFSLKTTKYARKKNTVYYKFTSREYQVKEGVTTFASFQVFKGFK